MRKILSPFVLLVSLSGTAQTVTNNDDAKQQTLLGAGKLNIGLSAGRSYGDHSIGFATHLVPRLQYFLKDGWSVAVEGELGKNFGTQSQRVGAGLTTRYYFLRGRRLALFGEAGAMFSHDKVHVNASDRYGQGATRAVEAIRFQTKVGLGVHYRVSDRWSIEGGVDRFSGSQGPADPDFGRWRAGVGVNFRLK